MPSDLQLVQQPLDDEAFEALALRKRVELATALTKGTVAEPISLTAVLVSLAISAGVSAAQYGLNRALTPKLPNQVVGKMSGSVLLQNSEQGLFINEIYGGPPEVTLVAGVTPTYQNVQNGTVGTGGAFTKTGGTNAVWDCGASHNVAVNSGDEAWIKFKVISGYATCGFSTIANPTGGNSDFKFGLQWNPDGSVTLKYNNTSLVANISMWVPGDEFTVELRKGKFHIYKWSAELFQENFVYPTPTFPLYLGIAIQYTGAGISACKVQINNIGPPPNAGRGGIKVAPTIFWSSRIRKLITQTTQTVGGKGGGQTQTVENVSYNIDLGLMWANHGPYKLLRQYANADVIYDNLETSTLLTGVLNPGTGEDPPYEPEYPPDPQDNYQMSAERLDGELSYDGASVGSGSIQGGSSPFIFYPGNFTQQPDPMIEANVDGKYGVGTASAHHDKAYTAHQTFSLERFGNAVPNFNGVLAHEELLTLADIYAAMSERCGLESDDYDWTGLDIVCRGLLINSLYAPADIIDSDQLQVVYNYFVADTGDKLVGYIEGDEPSVTIPDTQIGWLDAEGEMPDIMPEVNVTKSNSTRLPRTVVVKFISPDKEWEPDTQLTHRQIVDNVGVKQVEVTAALLSDEARAASQRALYREHVIEPIKFTLSWEYLYLHTGYKIIVTRAEGFSYTLRLTAIRGGIGILDCEGVLLEPEVYNQPASGVFPPQYTPPQQIPVMTIAAMLDVPRFRESDATNNGGVGFHVGLVPRTNSGGLSWPGAALVVLRNTEPVPLASSNVPATIGTVVSVSNLSIDPTTFDYVGTIVVDLYGTTATLETRTEADVLQGFNLACAGTMVFYFATATQVADYPNRWSLTGLLNGVLDTDTEIEFVAAGDRFALLNDAIQFVPVRQQDVGQLLTYKAVTANQSLSDAAEIQFAWIGNNLRARKLVEILIAQDSSGDLLIQATMRPRPEEQPASAAVEFWLDHTRNDPTKLKATLPMETFVTTAALLEFAGSDTAYELIDPDEPPVFIPVNYTNKNNLIADDNPANFTYVKSLQQVRGAGARIDITTDIPRDSGGTALPYASAFSNQLGLVKADDSGTPSYLTAPFVILWGAIPSPGDPNDHYVQVYSYGVKIYEIITTSAGELGHVQANETFTIMLVGNEFRAYRNWAPGKAPLAIANNLGTYPYKVWMEASGGSDIFNCMIQCGGENVVTTIFPARQQVDKFGAVQSVFFTRLYQKSRYNGIGLPVDL